MNDIKYSSKRRVLLQIKEYNQLHLSSIIDKKINKRNEISKLYYIFKKLEYKFNILETFIREVENKGKFSYEDLLVLSNYKFILLAKQKLSEKQLLIHNYIKEKEYIKYSHLSNIKNKIGIPTIDFSYLYCINDDVNINWIEVLKNNIVANYGEFEFNYFLFYTMYMLVLCYEFNTDNNHSIFIFNQVSNKIYKFLKDFNLG